MAPIGETGAADVAAGMGDEPGPAGAGAAAAGKKGSYVPPALRGDRAAAGERMGGSKFGERDDFATLRVTNVSTLCLCVCRKPVLMLGNRCPSWRKRESCETCSSALVVLPECSSPRTGRLAWPRALLSSALLTEAMPSRLARRWMDSVSSILFSGWSLPKRLSKPFRTGHRIVRDRVMHRLQICAR